MNPWEWEDLEYFFNSRMLTVADAGPLISPIQSFTITRDDDRQLVLKTVVPGYVSNDRLQHPPGTVRTIDDVVTLRSHDEDGLKFEAVAQGVISRECCSSLDRKGGAQTTETATLASISGSFKPDTSIAYTVEWLENVNCDGRIWTGATIKDTVETVHKRRLQAEESTVELVRRRTVGPSVNKSALRLEIDGVKLFLCKISQSKEKDRQYPGYILYVGHVDESKRNKVRNVLSFCLGYHLVYLGYVMLDHDFEVAAVKACSGDGLARQSGRVPALPPAPLYVSYENEVHQDALTRMARAIYAQYDELRFAELSWAYWHAMSAPAHMAAAHYGAALEALERTFAESKRAKKIIISNEPQWTKLRDNLLACLSSASLDESTQKLLTNKLSNLNQMPKDKIMEEILGKIGVPLGDMERKAWVQRHKAAHGSTLSSKDHIDMIRKTKLLRIMLHRMVLAATQAADCYYDYYSIGLPVRKIHIPPA